MKRKNLIKLALFITLAGFITLISCRREDFTSANEESTEGTATGSKNGRTARKADMFPSDEQAARQVGDFIKFCNNQITAYQYEARNLDVAAWVLQATANYQHTKVDTATGAMRIDSIDIPLPIGANGKVTPQDMNFPQMLVGCYVVINVLCV